jgi:hypothetical protein
MNKIKNILLYLFPYFGNGEFQNIENLFEKSYRESEAYQNVINDLKNEKLIEKRGGMFHRPRRIIATNFSGLAEGIKNLRNASGQYVPLTAKITIKGVEYLSNIECEITEAHKILILSANTEDSQRIRIDMEYKSIEEELKTAVKKGQIKIYFKHAVDLDSLMNAIIETSPKILHFSGHGSIDGIELEGHNQSFFLRNESLLKLIETLAKELECIVLNSCFSSGQAMRLSEKIDVVIGMGDSINDESALLFSKGFYKGVSARLSYAKCFELGKQMITTYDYNESEIPKLYFKNINNN